MEWISIHNRNVAMASGLDCLILFDTGEVRRLFEDNLPMDIITHWSPFPIMPTETSNNELASYHTAIPQQ